MSRARSVQAVRHVEITGMRSAHCVIAGLFATLLNSGLAQAAPLSIADAFKPTPILSMRLSPDGQRLLAFGWNGEAAATLVMDVATLTPKLVKSARGGSPWTARWLGKDLIVVAMGDETQLFDSSGKFFRVFDGRFLAALAPDGRGHERILVTVGRDYVLRIDVSEDRSTRIPFEWPEGVPQRWLMDRDGVPRVVTTATRDGTILTHWYRASAVAPWQAVESQLAVDSRWYPVALARDGRSLVVFSSEGRDTTAVFRYSLEEHALKEMLAGHPSEDMVACRKQAPRTRATIPTRRPAATFVL